MGWFRTADSDPYDCEDCGGTGALLCRLCDVEDPDRGNPCIDCGNTAEVQCPGCDGFGTLEAVEAAGYGDDA